MLSNVNSIWLPMNKKELLPGNQILGINNDLIDPNVIAFEHALEQIQNKLSLPEYNGPENFMETTRKEYDQGGNKLTRNEETSSTETIIQNPVIYELGQNQKIPREKQRKRKLIDTTSDNNKNMRLKMKMCNTTQLKARPNSHIALKQMTLDKYLFETNLLKSYTESSCSFMISCSTSTSVDSKNYIHQKILYLGNPTFLQNFENLCSLPLPNLNTDVISQRRKTVIPTEENACTKAPYPMLCFANEEPCKIDASFCNNIVKDSLDIDIDKAMQKYEVDKEPRTCFRDTGVQTTPSQVHTCNCLRYHRCEAFRGLTDDGCAARRLIRALDLDTLHHVKNVASRTEELEQYVPEIKGLDGPTGNVNNLLNVNVEKQFTSSNTTPKISSTGGFLSQSFQSIEIADKQNTQQAFANNITDIKNTSNLPYGNIVEGCNNIPIILSGDCAEHFPCPGEFRNLNIVLSDNQRVEIDKQHWSDQLETTGNNQKSLPQMEDPEEVLRDRDNRVKEMVQTKADTYLSDGCDRFVNYPASEEYGSVQDMLDEDEHPNTLLDTDQNVPDMSKDVNEAGQGIQTDPVLWSSSFQWRELPTLESTAERSFEEFLSLKPASQKIRRIGLSRKDKIISLHPKRRQNL